MDLGWMQRSCLSEPLCGASHCLHAYQFSESTLPRKECVTSMPHVSKRCIQFPELSLPRKEYVTSAFFTSTRTRVGADEEYLNRLGVRQMIVPTPRVISTMQSANYDFSTDPYFFPLFDTAVYGTSTVPPQLLPDPPLIETFDISCLSPPTNHLLNDTPLPNPFVPFETTWFDLASSSLPPLNNFLHRGSFHNQPAPLPFASGSEMTGMTGSHSTTPTRRVQNGSRRNEEERIEYLRNDKFIVSFTKARVTCAGCKKTIKLDTRNGARHYPGFWVRHREICKGVKK